MVNSPALRRADPVEHEGKRHCKDERRIKTAGAPEKIAEPCEARFFPLIHEASRIAEMNDESAQHEKKQDGLMSVAERDERVCDEFFREGMFRRRLPETFPAFPKQPARVMQHDPEGGKAAEAVQKCERRSGLTGQMRRVLRIPPWAVSADVCAAVAERWRGVSAFAGFLGE